MPAPNLSPATLRDGPYSASRLGILPCEISLNCFPLPISSRYMNRNENFVLVCLGSSGDLQADGLKERVEIVRDALIQSVELAALLFDQDAVTAKWR